MGHAQLNVRLERADQADVVALIDALDAYQRPLYPPESHHGIDIAALLRPNVLFCVARDAAGTAIGTGAVVLHARYGELKRMYVPPESRGLGVGRAVLAHLEQQCLLRECRLLRLETGISQPEAIRLYERAGFCRRPPFGGYRDDPLSLFMEKSLAMVAA